MPENWKTYKIGEITSEVFSGGTPSTKKEEYYGGNIPWLNTKEVDFRNIRHTEKFITELGLQKSSAKWVPKNAVIIAMYGNTAGKSAIAKIPLTTNQACCNLVINSEQADYRFVYYRVLNDYKLIKDLSVGGAQQNLNAGTIKNYEIKLPPLEEQKFIASILSALDDKIELNLQMNKTLEEMAETLFEQWFFEEAKEEWETFKLEDLIEIKGGFSYKGKFIGEGDSLLLGMGCVSFSERFLQSGARKYSGECNANHLVKPGDLVIATRQQSENMPILGAPASIPNSLQGKKVIVGTNLYRVNNVSFFSNNLLFQLLRSSAYQNHIKANSKGTTVRMITKDAVELFEFQIPPKSLLEEYDREITALSEQIEHNNLENQTLTQLRDTLLPKLISGEVRVKDVEKTLSEVL